MFAVLKKLSVAGGLVSLLNSPTGRQMTAKATSLATDPQMRQRISGITSKVLGCQPAAGTPTPAADPRCTGTPSGPSRVCHQDLTGLSGRRRTLSGGADPAGRPRQLTCRKDKTVMTDKATVLEILRRNGQDLLAAQLELPDAIDTDRHSGLLAKLGLQPADIYHSARRT